MKKEIFEVVGVKIYESDLSKEALKRIKKEILNNWETRTEEEKVTAVKSQLMTGKDLKEMILQEEKGYCVSDTVVMEIINDEKFEMDDEIWQNLSKSSSSWIMRKIAAKSSFPTAERLKIMLLQELKTYCNLTVVMEILNNERFEMDDEIWQNLSKSSSSWAIREVAAKSSFPTADKLKAMLLLELKTYCDPDVIIAIINNKRTKMDENIWKEILMAEKKYKGRESEIYKALYKSEFATAENLKAMALKELQTTCSSDGIIKILLIGNIKMDKELWSNLAKSKFQYLRETAAQSDFPTKTELLKMLKREVENECNKNVITAIISNPKFC